MIYAITNSYGEFNAIQHIGPAKWPHFDLMFIHNGHVSITIMGKEKINLHTGQAILIYPGSKFCGHSVTPITKVSVHHFKTLAETDFNKDTHFELFLRPSPLLIEHDIDRAVQLAYQPYSPELDKVRYALICLIIAQIRANENRSLPPNKVETEFWPMIAWLSENMEQSINLTDMAAKTNHSESYFRALFKNQLGVSPGTYFGKMKMDKSAKLLRETLMPIKEVSTKIGYKELTHFYRAFKAYHGTTPRAYRKKHLLQG
jgi:AraC-like DNA-binding protein